MFLLTDLSPGRALPIGVGATALMDLWLLLLARFGVRSSGFALVGRWIGHMAHGRFVHDAIAKAPPIRGEAALGWLAHYAIGIAFAFVLLAVVGVDWATRPTLLPALAFGVSTVLAPLLVMQPAMGAGVAAARTPHPTQARLRSVANHAVFGAGLYLTAALLS